MQRVLRLSQQILLAPALTAGWKVAPSLDPPCSNVYFLSVPDEKALMASMEEQCKLLQARPEASKPTTIAAYKMDQGNFIAISVYANDMDRIAFQPVAQETLGKVMQGTGVTMTNKAVLTLTGVVGFTEEVGPAKVGDRVALQRIAYKSQAAMEHLGSLNAGVDPLSMAADWTAAGVKTSVNYRASPTSQVVMSILSDEGKYKNRSKLMPKLMKSAGVTNPMDYVAGARDPLMGTCVFYGVVAQERFNQNLAALKG